MRRGLDNMHDVFATPTQCAPISVSPDYNNSLAAGAIKRHRDADAYYSCKYVMITLQSVFV